MEKRQRILIGVVGLLALVGLVTKGVPWFIEPLTDAEADLKEYKGQYEQLQAEVAKKKDLQARYRKLAARTLSLRDTEAGTHLHAILGRVADSSRLGKLTIGAPVIRRDKDAKSKARVTTARVHVSGQGSVTDAVNFLGAFYELPYMMRIWQLKLNPSLTKKGMTLRFDVDVETLVLQPNRLAGKEPVKTADLNPKTRPKATNRLKRRRLAAYDMIPTKNIFVPTVPRPPAKPTVAKGRKPPPKKRGRDPRPDTVVVLVTRYPWRDLNTGEEYLIQEMTTRDERTKEKAVYRTGEHLKVGQYDIGDLVYVDSYGAVVRTANREFYFYPAGKTLMDGERLDAKLHPDQYWAVQHLEQAEAGR